MHRGNILPCWSARVTDPIITVRKPSCWKVMFLHVSVMHGGVHAWDSVCVEVGEHVW